MMHLLWILLLVPVCLIGLGLLILVVGEFDPFSSGFSFRQIMSNTFGLACIGFWGAVLLGVVSLRLCCCSMRSICLMMPARLSVFLSGLA